MIIVILLFISLGSHTGVPHNEINTLRNVKLHFSSG